MEITSYISKTWKALPDKIGMAQYLDTYRMYTVALRRGDAVGVVFADAEYKPDTSGKGFVFTPPTPPVSEASQFAYPANETQGEGKATATKGK